MTNLTDIPKEALSATNDALRAELEEKDKELKTLREAMEQTALWFKGFESVMDQMHAEIKQIGVDLLREMDRRRLYMEATADYLKVGCLQPSKPRTAKLTGDDARLCEISTTSGTKCMSSHTSTVPNLT